MLTELLLQQAADRVQDSAAALPSAPFEGVDSVVVESPLPGGVAEVVRFLLDVVPWWVQVAGVVVAALVAIALVVLAIEHYRAVLKWLTTRHSKLQWAIAGGVLLLLLGAGGASAVAWDYTQHDNGFCTGCHVMQPAFQEFMSFEDKHDTLACHDCHQQSIYASVRQLYLWVAERPTEIQPHAKVANQVCMKCHVVEGDTAVWQRIASTAGHRVHLESDSTDLKDVQCVTCHGQEVHRFSPAPKTCGQSGCHDLDRKTLVLGKMANQTVAHCSTCHQFTAEVPLLATADSARGSLVPARRQCLGCHEMEAILADFEANLDPHGGTCGTCHNPHEQETSGAAVTTCASAGCHDDWRKEPFHFGREHRPGADQCLTCHAPHQSKVDASDCEACHTRVRARSTRRPPVPFDTLKALRAVPAVLPEPPWVDDLRGKGDVPPDDPPSGGVLLAPASTPSRPTPATQDSFPHQRHRARACLECHTTKEGHGGLTFVAPRGCDICHHQAPARIDCAKCHQAGELEAPRQATLRVTVSDSAPRPREIPFSHPTHTNQKTCVECHTTPVSLAPPTNVAECRSCHEDHHGNGRSCSSCHSLKETQARHTDPQAIHQRCDACHTRSTVALLNPTRPFCVTCHGPQREDHYEPRECTVCHFMAEPATFRSRLLRTPGSH